MEKGPKFGKNIESAEKELEIDMESGFFNAQQFSYYPVYYLVDLRISLIEEEGYSEAQLAIGATGEMLEMKDIIINEKISPDNDLVKRFVTSQYGSQDWAVSVFALLKEATFTRKEVENWILYNDPEMSNSKALKERGLGVALNKVYGEE